MTNSGQAASASRSRSREHSGRPSGSSWRATESEDPPRSAPQERLELWDDVGIEIVENHIMVSAQPNYAGKRGDTPKYSGHAERRDLFRPDENGCDWENPNPESCQPCQASFGDQGTVATVNAYGQLMQFGDYLGAGKSGMFSADQPSTHEPYSVCQRAADLRRLATRPFLHGQPSEPDSYGLSLRDIHVEARPTLKWVHWRWPRYEYLPQNSVQPTIQWVVHNRTVLQQVILRNAGESPARVGFSLHENVHIRDMDHMAGGYDFNSVSDGQQKLDGPGSYSRAYARRVESAPESGTSGNDRNGHGAGENRQYAVIVSSVFVDGEPKKLEPPGSVGVMDWEESVPSHSSIEVVVAYRFKRVPEKSSWKNFVIRCDDANVNDVLGAAPHFPASGLFDPSIFKGAVDFGKGDGKARDAGRKDWKPLEIEWAVTRSLEHVLSVCAVPLSLPPLEEDHGPSRLENGGRGLRPGPGERPYTPTPPLRIALTCGDLSNFRLTNKASFFACQFLLEARRQLLAAAKALEDKVKAPDRATAATCPDGSAAASAAAGGTATVPEGAAPTTKQDAATCAREKRAIESLLERIGVVCKGHVEWMRQAELLENKCFGSNYRVDGRIMTKDSSLSWAPQDSLTDTALYIIKAARLFAEIPEMADTARRVVGRVHEAWTGRLDKKDIRVKFVWPHAENDDVSTYRLDDHVWIWKALESLEDMRMWGQSFCWMRGGKPFMANDVRREILRRFTTENRISKKRMLAITRSARESRFLFHAGDTTLFDALRWNMFSSDDEIWNHTLEAQTYHDDNQETGWDKTQRYALAAVMGCRGHRMNDKESSNLLETALDVLLMSCRNYNGFLPGLINSLTRGAKLFDLESYRDSYFTAGFHIPYLFLTHAPQISEALRKKPLSGDEAYSADDVGKCLARLTKLVMEQEQPTAAARGDRPRGRMKKTMALSNVLDSSNIVEVADEWLYNYPRFLLGTGPIFLFDEMENVANAGVVIRGEIATLQKQRYRNPPGSSDLPQQETQELREDMLFQTCWQKISARVVDIRKPKSSKRSERTETDILSDKELWQGANRRNWPGLRSPRTAKLAKKRFLWLLNPGPRTALLCWAGSPLAEKLTFSLFFDRLVKQEGSTYFRDDTDRVLNRWETELHLSCYVLTPEHDSSPPQDGLPRPSGTEFPSLRGIKKHITYCSLGFRFDGDFFDRHWTCHLIEYVPSTAPGAQQKWTKFHQKEWRQRKVLELVLFERIMARVVDATKEILAEVRTELGIREGAISLSIVSSDDYFHSTLYLQKLQSLLQKVEVGLHSAMGIADRWQSREKDRGQERPRWTASDENKYRAHIRRNLIFANSKIDELKGLQADVRSLREGLAISMANTRDDLTFRGSENIRFFTYATVVFLPLGWATSVFSMSEQPSPALMATMAPYAAIALIATFTMLVNAGVAMRWLENGSRKISHHTERKMAASFKAKTLQWSEEKDIRDKTERDPKWKDTCPLGELAATVKNVQEKGLFPTPGDTYREELENTLSRRRKSRHAKDIPDGGDTTRRTIIDMWVRRNMKTPERAGGDGEPEAEGSAAAAIVAAAQRKAQRSNHSWHVRFWIYYLLVECPARQLLTACRILEALACPSRDQRRRTHEAEALPNGPAPAPGPPSEESKEARPPLWKSIVHVILGGLLIPLVAAVWICRVVCHNILDVCRYLEYFAERTFPALTSSSSGPGHERDDTYMAWLTYYPSSKFRPVRQSYEEARARKAKAREATASRGQAQT